MPSAAPRASAFRPLYSTTEERIAVASREARKVLAGLPGPDVCYCQLQSSGQQSAVRSWNIHDRPKEDVQLGPKREPLITFVGLDSPGIESRWGLDFLHLSRPALRPTQPPIHWVPGLSRGKVAGA